MHYVHLTFEVIGVVCVAGALFMLFLFATFVPPSGR